MKSKFGNALVVMSGLFLSSLALAQDAGAQGGSDTGMIAIGAGLAIGLAALGGTLAQGRAAGEALAGIARNPTAADKVFTPMIIGLALIEFQAIMGFIVAFLLSGKV